MSTPEARSAWAEFVIEVAGTKNTVAIARRAGLNQSTIYRWLHGPGSPAPRPVRQFMEAYGRNPVEAFVVLGWIEPSQTGVTAVVAPRDIPTGTLVARLRRLVDELERRADPAHNDGRRP